MSETTTAREQVLARTRYEHTAKSGQVYKLRYLDVLTLCERGVVPPLFAFGTDEERLAEAVALDERLKLAEERVALMRDMVSAALVDPVVWAGPEETRPEGALAPNDLGVDLFELYPIVNEKSDFTALLVRGAAFRTRDAGDGNPDRPDRDEAGHDVPGGDADVPGGVGA